MELNFTLTRLFSEVWNLQSAIWFSFQDDLMWFYITTVTKVEKAQA